MRKSSEDLRSQTPRTTGQQAPKPIYKAYSPATTPPDPRASVIASEIEGFFTALNVPPLQIKRQSEPPHPVSLASPSIGRESPVQRCASPPVPPKVKIEQEEEVQPCAAAELLQSPLPSKETPREDDPAETEECPPAYDESQRVPPPPEKPRTPSHPASSDNNLAASAAESAAQVGSSVAGADRDEAQAQAKDATDDAAHAPDGDASQADDVTGEDQPQVANGDGTKAGPPPPLPPRAAPSRASHQEIQPDTQTHVPGAFPPPPRRSPSPPQSGVAGAAASSATAVGAAVAMPSSDFAGGGLRQARNVLGQHMKNMVDRAKEHHEQHLSKKTTGSRAGIVEGKGKNILVIAPIA